MLAGVPGADAAARRGAARPRALPRRRRRPHQPVRTVATSCSAPPGSAGARFPLEVYASTRGVDGVPDGVHWYDPVEHALVQVGPAADGRRHDARRHGRAVAHRLALRRARLAAHLLGRRHAAVAAVDGRGAAPASRRGCARCSPTPRSASWSARTGCTSIPLALLSFGDGEPAIGSTGPATPGELPPVEFPLCTAAQRAGERDVLGAPWPEPELSDVPPSDTVDVGGATARLAAADGSFADAAAHLAGCGR